MSTTRASDSYNNNNNPIIVYINKNNDNKNYKFRVYFSKQNYCAPFDGQFVMLCISVRECMYVCESVNEAGGLETAVITHKKQQSKRKKKKHTGTSRQKQQLQIVLSRFGKIVRFVLIVLWWNQQQ